MFGGGGFGGGGFGQPQQQQQGFGQQPQQQGFGAPAFGTATTNAAPAFGASPTLGNTGFGANPAPAAPAFGAAPGMKLLLMQRLCWFHHYFVSLVYLYSHFLIYNAIAFGAPAPSFGQPATPAPAFGAPVSSPFGNTPAAPGR